VLNSNCCAIIVLQSFLDFIVSETTTIRLPAKLRQRVRSLVKNSGRSAHSLILEAVERQTSYEEQMQDFVRSAQLADEEIERAGEVYRLDDVHQWMKKLAQGKATKRPKPWRR
jgi:predicted DNA-binding protein